MTVGVAKTPFAAASWRPASVSTSIAFPARLTPAMYCFTGGQFGQAERTNISYVAAVAPVAVLETIAAAFAAGATFSILHPQSWPSASEMVYSLLSSIENILRWLNSSRLPLFQFRTAR